MFTSVSLRCRAHFARPKGSAQFDLVSGSFSSVSPIWTLWCIALACDAPLETTSSKQGSAGMLQDDSNLMYSNQLRWMPKDPRFYPQQTGMRNPHSQLAEPGSGTFQNLSEASNLPDCTEPLSMTSSPAPSRNRPAQTCTSFLNLPTLETFSAFFRKWNSTLCMGLHVRNLCPEPSAPFSGILGMTSSFQQPICETQKHSAVWGINYRRSMLNSSPPCFQTQTLQPAFSLRSSKSDLAWHDAANTMIHGTQIAQSSSRLSWTQINLWF